MRRRRPGTPLPRSEHDPARPRDGLRSGEPGSAVNALAPGEVARSSAAELEPTASTASCTGRALAGPGPLAHAKPPRSPPAFESGLGGAVPPWGCLVSGGAWRGDFQRGEPRRGASGATCARGRRPLPLELDSRRAHARRRDADAFVRVEESGVARVTARCRPSGRGEEELSARRLRRRRAARAAPSQCSRRDDGDGAAVPRARLHESLHLETPGARIAPSAMRVTGAALPVLPPHLLKRKPGKEERERRRSSGTPPSADLA